MISRRTAFAALGLAVLVSLVPSSPMAAAQPQRGRNMALVRGKQIEVYYYPQTGGDTTKTGKIVFAPGDGGWRGVAVAMADQMASWGYDVFGLDTKQYLESFTGKTRLSENDVMADMRRISDWAAPEANERVALVGWSEGAGLLTLAAAAAAHKQKYVGLVTLGLGDENVLGWRWKDYLTYVTKAKPEEPSFSSLRYVPLIAPLPLVMLQSTHDEYVSRDEAQRLYEAASEPKRFVPIDAGNHRFDGNQEAFYRELKAALEWIRKNRP